MIKCPRCLEEGYKQQENKTNYFNCPFCQFKCLLKYLAYWTEYYNAKISGLFPIGKNEDNETEYIGTDKQWNNFNKLSE